MGTEEREHHNEELPRTYTFNPRWENVAHASYEAYFEFLESINLIDGRYPLDDLHAFFIWLSRDPKFQDIEGYPVVDIYEKNVIEGSMSEVRFLEWCRDSSVPTPHEVHGEMTQEGQLFIEWYEQEVDRTESLYTAWTTKYHVDISEGAVMRFIDENAQAYYIATDFEDRGMIVG